jgi:putative glutamine amidotransferase
MLRKSRAGPPARSTRSTGRASKRWARIYAVEARAPDGVIEAFRVADSPSFALGLQWHPEWQFERNPFSSALFAAFGEASRRRAAGTR